MPEKRFGILKVNWCAGIGELLRAPNWTIRSGFAFDPTPVRNQFRTTRVPHADRYWLAVGLGYQWTAALRLHAFMPLMFISFVPDAPINETSPSADVLIGRYSHHL